MAKHKRKRTKKVSKGLRPSISPNTLKLVRRENVGNTSTNKLTAWMRGKRGYITIANPNSEETNRRFIKVTFEKYFGGSYKDIKSRVKRSEDKNKVEFAL